MPPAEKAVQAGNWQEGGNIPSAQGIGHYLYMKVKDLNGDGADDLVVGGRRGGEIEKMTPEGPIYDNTKKRIHTEERVTGLLWIEAPTDPEDRHDLSKWQTHQLAPSPCCYGTHGFVFADFDADGDDNVANLDSDWNTPYDAIKFVWWENSRPCTPEQRRPWT